MHLRALIILLDTPVLAMGNMCFLEARPLPRRKKSFLEWLSLFAFTAHIRIEHVSPTGWSWWPREMIFCQSFRKSQVNLFCQVGPFVSMFFAATSISRTTWRTNESSRLLDTWKYSLYLYLIFACVLKTCFQILLNFIIRDLIKNNNNLINYNNSKNLLTFQVLYTILGEGTWRKRICWIRKLDCWYRTYKLFLLFQQNILVLPKNYFVGSTKSIVVTAKILLVQQEGLWILYQQSGLLI